jgi:DNA-binding beta-propeller fold protein YncE/outer membrane protein OmpA-like peptidoglycan-associated protein
VIRRRAALALAGCLTLSTLFAVAGLVLAAPDASAATPMSSFVNGPEAIANDGSHVWVVNSTDNSVTELNEDGSFVQSIPVGTGPDAVAADGTYVWVANTGSDGITVLNANGTVVGTYYIGEKVTGITSDGGDAWITVGVWQEALEIDPQGVIQQIISTGVNPTGISSDGANVWIANSGDGTVTDYNLSTFVTNTIAVGTDPTGVFSDGQYVWITNSGDGTVTVLNASDGSYAFSTDTSPIPVGNDPTGVTSDGTDVWVTNTQDGTVSELDQVAGTVQVVGTYPVGNGPAAVALNGPDVWVDNAGDGTVSELDGPTGTLEQSINIIDESGLEAQTIATGSWPAGPTSISSDGTDVWVADDTDNTVSEYDASTSALLQTIPVGDDPVSISSDGEYVWVVNAGDDTITVLNASDGSYAFNSGTSPIPDPDGPLSVMSDGIHVWITNTDNTITVLNAQDGTYAYNTDASPIADGDGPVGVSSDGVHVWIYNSDNTITVLDANTGDYAFGTDVTPIPDPDGPDGVTSDGTYAWFSNLDGTVTVLNAFDGSYAFGTGTTPIALPQSCADGISSNETDVWVISQCSDSATELNEVNASIIQTVALDYQPIAVSLDDNGDVWISNGDVGNTFSLADGGLGYFDGAVDPNDQGTLTELSSPAPEVTTTTDSTNTETFNYTPTTQTFTVPAGVTQLTLSAVGAEGSRGGRDSSGRPVPGGYQGVVDGTIAVTPGEVLTIAVGHGGHDSPLGEFCSTGADSLFDPNNAIGGSNPLGAYSGGNGGAAGEQGCSGYGGAGGAASVVELGTTLDPTSVATVVAGGSGGSGGSGQYPRTIGQLSLPYFEASPVGDPTDGEAGISIFNACVGASSCDGGGGAGGGGGAQGGDQGLVQFGSGQSNEWFGLGASPGANSTSSLGGLSASYAYYAGDGADGAVTISYDTGLPGTPTNVVATQVGTVATVSWTAPAVTGTSAIEDYLIRFSNDGGVTWLTYDPGSAATSAQFPVPNAVDLLFEVAAVNQLGQGDWSVLADPPGAPVLTGITPGNAYVSIPFTTGGDGGSAITGYAYSIDGGNSWQDVSGVASPLLISGLTNGTTYTIEVKAINAAGTSPASNTETATPFTVPDTPDATQIVTTPQDGQVGVSWVAPNDNGAAISEYTITLYDASFAGDQLLTCDVSNLTCYDGNSSNPSAVYAITGCTLTTLTCTITGLSDDETYWVSIQAENQAGASGRSSPRVPSTLLAQFSVAYNANGATGGTPPIDGSSPYYDGTNATVLANTGGLVDPGSIFAGWNTLADGTGTPYVAGQSFAVTAATMLYAVWSSVPVSPSPPTPPTVSPPGPPGAPLDAGPSILTSAGLLTWSAPTSDGGSPITGYTVTNTAGVVLCTTTGALTCHPSGLTGVGPFVLTLTATNAYGVGARDTFSVRALSACGTSGTACKVSSRLVRLGVVFFAESKFAVAGRGVSHATLVACAIEIVRDDIRTVNVTGTTDDHYLVAFNMVLSKHRAEATVAALRAILRTRHDSLPRFDVRATGISRVYAGDALNRRVTITGVVVTNS